MNSSPPTPPDPAFHRGGDVRQYVSFWVDKQLFGVPVEHVQEVLNPQTIAPTPRARVEISGLLNLRGQIVTAVDLRRRLGLKPQPNPQGCMNVVITDRGESFSLLVDDVGEVISIAADRLEPMPSTLDSLWKGMTSGVFRLDDRLLLVLDVAAVLDLTSGATR